MLLHRFQQCIYVYMAIKSFSALLVVYDTNLIKFTVQSNHALVLLKRKGKVLKQKVILFYWLAINTCNTWHLNINNLKIACVPCIVAYDFFFKIQILSEGQSYSWWWCCRSQGKNNHIHCFLWDNFKDNSFSQTPKFELAVHCRQFSEDHWDYICG